MAEYNGKQERAKQLTAILNDAAKRYYTDGSSTLSDTEWDSFEGQVLAVIRSTKEPGVIRLKVSAEGCEEVEITIESK